MSLSMMRSLRLSLCSAVLAITGLMVVAVPANAATELTTSLNTDLSLQQSVTPAIAVGATSTVMFAVSNRGPSAETTAATYRYSFAAPSGAQFADSTLELGHGVTAQGTLSSDHGSLTYSGTAPKDSDGSPLKVGATATVGVHVFLSQPLSGTVARGSASIDPLPFQQKSASGQFALVSTTMDPLMENNHAIPYIVSTSADAPSAPGVPSAWTSGNKDGIGTSTTTQSNVWYTLGAGIMNEVYYPTVDTANVQDLQYVVADGKGYTQLERDDTDHAVVLTDPRALSYKQVNTAKDGRYRITKTYTTDPARAVLLVSTQFEVFSGGPLDLYVLYNPSLNNSGMGDTGATENGELVASDGSIATALSASTGFIRTTSGYSGTSSDGWSDLRSNGQLTNIYSSAKTPGNLVQVAQIPVGTDTTFTLGLGFGPDRNSAEAAVHASLGAGFGELSAAYNSGWHDYLASLKAAPAAVSTPELTTQYNVAVMMLKAHEDKTYRGANVASLTNPWGDASNADNPTSCGYHAVWARDLYEIATALDAAGDRDAANRSLDYLLGTQQRPDGSFPQNTHLNGSNCWTSLQMDEVAFPLLLAWQLNRTDAQTWAKVKLSADYIVSHGPATPEERWEENGGYSPSTIAAEVAGLVAAADIASKNSAPDAAAKYLAVADNWQANVKNWTLTTTGPLSGSHRYFERIDDNGNPNDGGQVGLKNGGGTWDERQVVDQGFLELTRLGVLPANDPDVASSLKVIDDNLQVLTPEGPLWHRYNHDGYGETSTGAPYTGAGIGRAWPVFSGERGEYELANGRAANSFLKTMAATANAGYLIPEQVWDQASTGALREGKATGSAGPLAWSMAQFVRLAQSSTLGNNAETPSIVATRYAAQAGPCATSTINFGVNATTSIGQTIWVVGDAPELGSWNPANGVQLSSSAYPFWSAQVHVPSNSAVSYKYVRKDASGNVTWESGANRTIRSTAACATGTFDAWK